MPRNRLKNVAGCLVSMAVGERAQPLYLAVADYPDGRIEIDLLTASARLGSTPLPDNSFTQEIVAWLGARLRAANLVPAHLDEAHLILDLDSSSVRTMRERLVHYLVTPQASIRTSGGVYAAALPPPTRLG